MMMRLKKRAGFTIVETMMFLAVSGVIFVSVALMISGQLDKYQSKDAMNQLESSVRGVLNDVTNGYYPMIGQEFNCSGPTGVSGENRGTNQNCVLAGKSIKFESQDILIETYVTSKDTQKIPENINVISASVSPDRLTPIDSLKETKSYQWGIMPKTNDKYFILNTIYSYNTSDFTASQSGSQNVELYYSSDDGGILQDVTTNTNKACFKNGGHNSSLEFGIGGTLTVKTNFQDTSCT